MSFASPWWLLGLLLLPLALAAYLAARRRARRFAVRFTAVPALRLAAGTAFPWRRHLPAAMLLVALAAIVTTLARPERTVRIPVGRASIVLVTDHSGSMNATDVTPSRLAAAQRAADTFIKSLPQQVRVGVVAFSNAPDAVEAPGLDHASAQRIVDAQLAFGATATGDALALALQLLHSGPKLPSAIVLLSDGSANTGQDPLQVAGAAAAQKVPIYTVALGTENATVPNPNQFGPPLAAPPDPELMAAIARASHAQTFTAQDAGSLNSIYKRLGSQLGTATRKEDITTGFAIASLVLLAAAAGASLALGSRLP
ncbi:MAG: Ca-activated chloride channel [Solirubrobacteraceae bacterium]|jgi:Ca-activated chloride channel family protein|nr:Ca-activated chloride channel [Solirubrobacteraceae bacterium]MEA2302242.1 Ca-activated chloride channel [Solirubrobacteraceae bacterium]MEA2355974.1 Ca-activated chloride channel [Solirubrobacteraceae bacterium]